MLDAVGHSAYGLLEFTVSSLIPFLLGLYVGVKRRRKNNAM